MYKKTHSNINSWHLIRNKRSRKTMEEQIQSAEIKTYLSRIIDQAKKGLSKI